MHNVFDDIRYAARFLTRRPGFALQVALTLGLGIGFNVCIFSVFDQVALNPPVARDLDQLAVVLEADPANPNHVKAIAPATFRAWQANATCFERIAAYEGREARIGPEGSAEFARMGLVTSGFFRVLGVAPALGREFTAEEEAGRSQPVMLSHAYWTSRFQADRAVLGTTLRLDGQDRYVVGVMPASVGLPQVPDMWRPRIFDPVEANNRDTRALTFLGRIKPGLSITQVREEMNALVKSLDPHSAALVTTARQFVTEQGVRVFLSLLLGAVGFVLMIACANVSVLQLARGLGRQGEIALRATLGASRWRIVRQLLVESLLLSLMGACFGVLLASWGLELIRTNMPANVARTIAGWGALSIDGRALVFTLLLTAFTAILSTLMPALRLSRSDLNRALKEGVGASSLARRRHRARSVLVAAQVGLTMVLLVGATLMIDGFITRSSVSEDVAPKTLAIARLDLRPLGYDQTRLSVALEETIAQLEALPQVRSAALVGSIPFQRHGGATFQDIQVDGQPPAASEARPNTMVQRVSENYFRTMNLRLLLGREFNAQDRRGSAPVAIVSETTARMLLASADGTRSPIGRLIRLGPAGSPDPWTTVVGVVADIRYFPFGHGSPYVCYQPFAQQPGPVTGVVVRTRSNSASAVPLMNSQIAGMRLGRFPFRTSTMEALIVESTIGLAYVATLLTVFATASLVFSLVGIYGVMAWMVQERTREIGIRVALGAREGEVVRMMVRGGAVAALIGVAAGILGGLALNRSLSSFLFGTGDAGTFTVAGLALLLATVSAAACWIPARRAARVDPLLALRAQ